MPGLPASDPIRALLVDDSAEDAARIRTELGKVEFRRIELVHATSLEEAGRLLAGPPCSVLLLDLCLPEQAGIANLKAARFIAPKIPIIVLTGVDDPFLSLIAVRHGADDYLIKDRVDGQLLSRSIQYAIERQKFHAEIDLQENKVRQAQKMEVVGRLAGGMAHDFNNILTAIKGYTQLVVDQIGAQHPGAEDLHHVRRAADRGAGLIRQLLAFSRKQSLQPQILKLNATLQDMERLLRRLLGESIDLRLSLDDRLDSTRVDPAHLEQIIMNLVINAGDAMPKGGTITIATCNDTIDPEFARRHAGAEPGSYVRLDVSDTGSGMGPDTLARLFEPFFTTKERGKGTGLGLATVYGIIKQSGGYIAVESALGKGTTFSLFFPRVDPRPPDTDRKPAPLMVRGGSETLLLVEDEEDVRSLLKRMLEKRGYRVLVADSGAQAIKLMNEPTVAIDLLVTDVVMPGMNGPDLLLALRERFPALKAVFMSGYTDTAILRRLTEYSDCPFLGKPFEPEALAKKVRETLNHARA